MKLYAALLCSLLCVSAFAEGESQFYYQPEDSRGALTTSFVLLSRKAEIRSSQLNVKSTGSVLSLEYEHALSNELSLGAEVSSSRQTDDVEGPGGKTESKGLQDIEINLKGRKAAGEGLHYGVKLKLSPGKSETDSDGDSNRYSGGHSFTPYVGYEWAVTDGFAGVRLSRDFQLGKADVEDESTGTMLKYKLGGGEITTLDLFYETALNDRVSLGAVLELAKQQDIKITGSFNGTLDGKSGNALVAYVPVKLGNGILIPRLQFIRFDNGLYKDNHIATLGVAYRVEF